jgi:predicted transcriptional regulator
MRRNRYDIFFEILDVCREETSISHILYKCRLSYAQAKECLAQLDDNGFVKRDGTTFKSTGEGVMLMEKFEDFFRKLNSVSRT